MGMRIIAVVGTRPQIIKAAVLLPVLREHHNVTLVDTGQHWDDNLAGAFYRELGLDAADQSLNAGGGSNSRQVSAMMAGLEPIFEQGAFDACIVFGDTNSTLTGALTAAHFNVPIAHVEAGLRSFDRRMSEEINRVLVDHIATWNFAPTMTAMTNLAEEGLFGWHVGDLMADLCARTTIGKPTWLRDTPYIFATVHRAENREPVAIDEWLEVLGGLGYPVLLSLHPGTRRAMGDRIPPVGVTLLDPVDYATSLALQSHALAVITDSGGTCVCSNNLTTKLEPGKSINLWARFPAPPAEVKEVSVIFPHFIPTDAPISE